MVQNYGYTIEATSQVNQKLTQRQVQLTNTILKIKNIFK